MKFVFIDSPELSAPCRLLLQNQIKTLSSTDTIIFVSDANFTANENLTVLPTKWYFEQRNYECDIVVLCNSSHNYIDALSSNMCYKLSMYWFLSEAKLCSLAFPKEHLYAIDKFLFLSSNEQSTFIHATGMHKEKTIHIDNLSNQYQQLCEEKTKACQELQLLKGESDSLEKLIKYQNIVPYFRTRVEAANYFLHQGNLYFNSPYLNIAESMFLKSWAAFQSDSCANNIFLLYRKTKEYEKMYYWLNINISKQFRHDFIQDIVEVLPNLSTMSRIGFLSYMKLLCNSSNDNNVSYRFAQSIGALSYHLRCMLQHGDAKTLLRSLVKRLQDIQTVKRDNYLLESYTSALMFASNYDYKDAQYIEDCRKYETFREVSHVPQKFIPNSKVRIGFLSGDISNHPVTYVLNGFMEYMDKAKFEIYLLDDSNPAVKQLPSIYLKKHVDHDINIYSKTVEESVIAIQECNLDILIEMTGHTSTSSHKLMNIVRHKPAKIICSYFGYPCTTGIQAVSFKLGDAITFPESSKHIFTEEFQTVKDGFHCFKPYDDTTITKTKAPVTRYGVFNNPQKYTKQYIDTVSKILHEVPESQIYFCYNEFRDESMREFYKIEFESRGIERSRVFFRSASTYKEYAKAFIDVDIALDTFPYNGGTVSMDCLNFSTPYITLLGTDYVSCVGASIITQAGHPELVAKSIEEYVRNAVLLAKNKPMLEQYHANIRNDMYKSSLGDGKQFATHFQEAIMEMLYKKGISVKKQHSEIVLHQPKTKKKIGILMRYQPDIYTNGAGMNCVFLRQSLEAIGYDVECLAYIDAGKPTLIYEMLPYKYIDINTCDFKEYSIIIYGTGLPPASIYKTFKALGIQTFAFHPATSYDGFHNEAFIYPSKAISMPLIEQSYEHSANTSLVISTHVKTTSDYIHTLSRNHVPAKSIRHIWSPLFLNKNGTIPKYKQKTPRSKVDLVIIEPNVGYCKSGWVPLVACEAFYKANADIVENVYSYNYPRDSTESTKMIRALTIWKDGKLKLMDRQHINDILVRFADSKNITVFISHNINCELNYAYFDVMYSGFPFVHNSKSLQHEKLGYYYDLVSEGAAAIQQALNHDPEKACESSKIFFDTIHPLNASFLNELSTIMGENKPTKHAYDRVYSSSEYGPSILLCLTGYSSEIDFSRELFPNVKKTIICEPDIDLKLFKGDTNLNGCILLCGNLPCSINLNIVQLKQFVEEIKPSAIYFTSDEYAESAQWLELSQHTKLFLRNYNHGSYNYTQYNNMLQVPLGYMSGFLDAKLSSDFIPKPMDQRKFSCSFIGTVKSDRSEMIDKFQSAFEDAYIRDIQHDWNLKQFPIPPSTVHNIYSDSKFVLCGRGNKSLDCFRNYEAIVSGAIPVIVGSKGEIETTFYYNGFIPPCIFAQSWDEAIMLCKKLIADPAQLQEAQNAILRWWKSILRAIHTKIDSCLNHAVVPREKKKVGIFVRQQNFYSNGAGMNCVFLAQSLESLGYKVDLIANIDPAKPMTICDRLAYTYKDMKSCNYSEYEAILFGTQVPHENEYMKIRNLGIKILMFHPCNSYDQMHNEQFMYVSDNAEFPLFEATFQKYADTVLVTDNHAATALTYVGTLNENKLDMQSIRLTWHPLFLYKDNVVPRYVNRSKESKLDIVIIEANIGYCKCGWLPLVIAERFYKTNPDRVGYVHYFSRPAENSEAMKLIQSLQIWKENKIVFYNRCPINDILSYFGDGKSNEYRNVAFLSHSINSPMNYAYFDILYSGFPFVHNSQYLKSKGQGYYYETVEEGSNAILNTLHHDALQVCERSKGFFDHASPFDKSFLSELDSLVKTKQSVDKIQIIVPTASDERKATMERQFAELDIPYPVHYLEAKILDKEAVGYVPETMSLIDKRIVLSTRSHIRAIELAGRDSSPEFSLIMEDDVAIHREDFKRVLNEIVENYEKYVFEERIGYDSGILSLGWIPCANYIDFYTNPFRRKIDNRYGIFNHFYTPGTQAYLIKRNVAKKHTPLFCHNSYEELRNAVLSSNIKTAKIHESVIVFDDFGTKMLHQSVLFPPLVIEQVSKSLIRGTTENPFWEKFFKGVEGLKTQYWSF